MKTAKESMVVENDNVKLCVATDMDVRELGIVASKIFEETFQGKMPEDDLQKYLGEAFNDAKISSEIADAGNLFLLIQHDHKIIGYAKLRLNKKPETLESKTPIEMERLYLLQEHHNKGFGNFLLQSCIEEGIKMGSDVIWLAVWEKNEKAINFYVRNGFEVFGAQIFMRGDDPQKGLLMKKALIEIR